MTERVNSVHPVGQFVRASGNLILGDPHLTPSPPDAHPNAGSGALHLTERLVSVTLMR